MYESLIYVLEQAIESFNGNIKKMSNDIRYLKPVYDKLVPNKKRKGVINIYDLGDVFDLFMEVIFYNNKVLYNKIHRVDQEGIRHDNEVYINEFNMPYSNVLSDTYKSREYRKKEEELYQKSHEIFMHACAYYVELYETIEQEKQETKDKVKSYGYALKNIKSKNPLTTSEISYITNLINELLLSKELKEVLFDELNDYIKNTKKEKIFSIPSKKEVIKQQVIYIDDDMNDVYEEEQENEFSYNYLVTLKSFNSFNDINIFLDSIKYTCDINKVIQNVISLLSDSKEDNLLKEYLEKYALTNGKKEEQEEINNIDNVILYYGFYEEKNKILSDIVKSDIPKDYYKDVLYAIDMIKNGDSKNKLTRISSVKKVLKLRYKDIRITYKKLSNNIYIILGVFYKNDNKGYDVVDITRQRNKELIKQEKSIIEAIKIPELWDAYLKENSNKECEIISALKNKVK